MRVLAARLASAFGALFGSSTPFWPTWEEIVEREVLAQRERAAAAAPPASAPFAARRVADGPTEKTVSLVPAAPARVTYVGRVDLTAPAMVQPAALYGASASR